MRRVGKKSSQTPSCGRKQLIAEGEGLLVARRDARHPLRARPTALGARSHRARPRLKWLPARLLAPVASGERLKTRR